MPRMRPRRRRPGFTLIELLVVLVILGLLAGIAVPQVIRYLGSARTTTARTALTGVATALDLYRIDVGRLPTQAQGLQALVARPTGVAQWNGPYLKSREQLNDPWGRPFIYRHPGQHGEYDLFTLGADNAPGGEREDQDVANW